MTLQSSKFNSSRLPIFLSQELTLGQLGSITNVITPPTVSSQKTPSLADGNVKLPVLRNVLFKSIQVGNEHSHRQVKNMDMLGNITNPGPTAPVLRKILTQTSNGSFQKMYVQTDGEARQNAQFYSGKKVLQPNSVIVPVFIRSPQVISNPPVFNSKPLAIQPMPLIFSGQSAIIGNPQLISHPTVFNQYSTQLANQQSLVKNLHLQPSSVQSINDLSCNNFSHPSIETDDEIQYLYTEDGTNNNHTSDKEDHMYSCLPEVEHNYSKPSTFEESQRVIGRHQEESRYNISIPSNGTNKEYEKEKECDLVSNSDIDADEDFSTTLKTCDGGEQIMVVNPILENRQTDNFVGSDKNSDSSISVDDSDFKTMKKYLLNEQIMKSDQTSSETENTNPPYEWKIESVYSLALKSDSMNQDTRKISSPENESISGDSEKETLEEHEMKTFSLTGSEWKKIITPSFVVLERLAESIQAEPELKDSASRCSQYCRLRTLKLLCDLNLLNCCYKNDEKGRVNEIAETPQPNVPGSNMYDRVKKTDLKRKSTTSSPYSLLSVDEKKPVNKTPSSLKDKSKNKDSEALQQLKAQITQNREYNKKRKIQRQCALKRKATVNDDPFVHQGSLRRISLSLKKKNAIVKDVVKNRSKNKNGQSYPFHHSSESSHKCSEQSNVDIISNVLISPSKTSTRLLTKNKSVSTSVKNQFEGNGDSSFRAQNPVASNIEQNSKTSTEIQTPTSLTSKRSVVPSVTQGNVLQRSPPNAMKQSSILTDTDPHIPHKTFSVVQSGSKRFLTPSTTARPVSARKLGVSLDSLSKFIQKSPDKLNNNSNNYFLVNIDGQHVLIKTGGIAIKKSSSDPTNKNVRLVPKGVNMPASSSSSASSSSASSSSASSSSSSSAPFIPSVPLDNIKNSSTHLTQQKYSTAKQDSPTFTPKTVSKVNIIVTKIKKKTTSSSLSSNTLNLSRSFITPPKHNPKPAEDVENSVTLRCNETTSKPHLKRSLSQSQSPPTTIEELKRRKRQRLEAKYPLPPGVVIKSEPISTGYDLDNNWSVTSEIDMGFVQEGHLDHDSTLQRDHSTTPEIEETRNPSSHDVRSNLTTMELSVNERDDMPPMLEKVSPAKGRILNHSFDDDKAPPVLHQMLSSPPLRSLLPSLQSAPLPSSPLSPSPLPLSPPLPPFTDAVIELDVDGSHNKAPPTILQRSPSLPQLSSPPQIPSQPSSLSSPPLLQSPYKVNHSHSSPISKVSKNNNAPLDLVTATTATSPLNPTCESGYDSLTASSSSETLDSSSSSSKLVNDGNGSNITFFPVKSKIQQLKELLKKKEQQVDNLLKIQSQLPQVDLDSI